MFNFLRFLIFLAMLAICGMAGYAALMLPSLTTQPIVQLVERSHSGFAEGYINTVWKKYREAVVPLFSTEPPQLQGHPEVVQFATETMQYFQALPMLRANIYTASGTLLLTVNGGGDQLSGASASPDALFVSNHLQSETIASKLLPEAAMKNGHAQVVQTVVPIRMPGATATEGRLEIISDTAEVPPTLLRYGQYGIGAIAAASLFFLFVLFISLFIVSAKSEAIITKQHEANLELMEAVNAAQAENRDKSQFLANVSHELRTPLNAIIGFSEMLKNELMPTLTDRKYDNFVNDIHAAGVHLLSLINDILDYSKAEAGKLELEVSEINVTKLVQNSLRLVGPRAETGQIKLVEALPKDTLIMTTDSKKFKQVLLNLLSNAVKFTPAGGEVSVTAWQNVADDSITFEVRDTGIGIAPKDISRAMAPFGQVDNTLKRKYEGTGLGLPLTKKFVELMGGKFTIESEVNKGTKITFTLPRKPQPREGLVIKPAV